MKFLIEVAFKDKKGKQRVCYLAEGGGLVDAIGDGKVYEAEEYADVYKVLYAARGVMPHEYGIEMTDRTTTAVSFDGSRRS